MEDTPNPATFFNVFFTGQIEALEFPLGPEAPEVFCRYEVTTGPDWDLVSGIAEGITQLASNSNRNFNDKIVLNMPIELTYRTTGFYGWPQMVISVFGKKKYNLEFSLGYARVHLPVMCSGNSNQSLVAPILKPKSSNMISEMANWFLGKTPELKNPMILTDSSKAKGLAVESYGEIYLKISVISRGSNQLGYDWD